MPPLTLKRKSLERTVGMALHKKHMFSLDSNHLWEVMCIFQGQTSPVSQFANESRSSTELSLDRPFNQHKCDHLVLYSI